MKRIKLFPLLKQAAGWITVVALVSVLMVWQFSYKSAAAGIVSKGTTTEDSVAVSCFVADSLGNPNNLAADTFLVLTIGPQGDSIYGAKGVPADAAFTGELDSLTVGTIGKLYIYTNAVSVIDGAGDVGTYELLFSVKKSSPKYVNCAKTEFQIVDTTLNYKLNQIAEILDSLKTAATLAELSDAIGDTLGARGLGESNVNLVVNASFERDSVITTTAPLYWSQLAGGDWTTAGVKSNLTIKGTGRWRYELYPAGADTSLLYQALYDLSAGLYYFGCVGKTNTAGALHLFIDNTGTPSVSGWVDSIETFPSSPAATVGKFFYFPGGDLSIGAALYTSAGGQYGSIDNVILLPLQLQNPVMADTTAGGGPVGTSLWTAPQRDSVLARLLNLGDSLQIVTDSLKNMHNWIASQGTLANMGLYDGSYYDTTAVILYPLGQVPKDSARVYQVTGGWAGVWTYRATIKYSIKNRSSSTSNVIDTIRFARP